MTNSAEEDSVMPPTEFTTVPKAPDFDWLKLFVSPGMLAAKAYHIDRIEVDHKLDQNESPWDWPETAKGEVMRQLAAMQWNRYPEAFNEELHRLVAAYNQVPRENVLIGPGSNHICTLVISAFGRSLPGELVVARPSFPLYETYSRSIDLPYRTWDLDADLEYREDSLAGLRPGSLVIFASPNNPVGNMLGYDRFESLLRQHPDSLFCADEAYFEYGEKPYTPLLGKYPNLIIVRTFSKTLSAAGIRLGIALGHKYYLDQVKKLLLPFTINHFTLCACRVALTDPAMREFFQRTIAETVSERRRAFDRLAPLADRAGFRTKESFANFFLMRFSDDGERERVYRGLIDRSILVRDISKGPGLSGCIRISLGTRAQNDLLLDAIESLVS